MPAPAGGGSRARSRRCWHELPRAARSRGSGAAHPCAESATHPARIRRPHRLGPRLLLYVLNFTQRLPAWWLAMQGALALLAALALAMVAVRARGSTRPAPGIKGPAGGIADDLQPLGEAFEHPAACAAVATAAGFV